MIWITYKQQINIGIAVVEKSQKFLEKEKQNIVIVEITLLVKKHSFMKKIVDYTVSDYFEDIKKVLTVSILKITKSIYTNYNIWIFGETYGTNTKING